MAVARSQFGPAGFGGGFGGNRRPGQATGVGIGSANAGPGGFAVGLGTGVAVATPFGNIAQGFGNSAAVNPGGVRPGGSRFPGRK